MTTPDNRRNFLAQSTVAATGLFIAGRASGQGQETQPPVHQHSAAKGAHGDHMQKMDHAQHTVESEYPRTRPGYAGPIGGPQDRGRLVPGLRPPDEPPVPILAPDLKQLEWSLVDGVKEFHLMKPKRLLLTMRCLFIPTLQAIILH